MKRFAGLLMGLVLGGLFPLAAQVLPEDTLSKPVMVVEFDSLAPVDDSVKVRITGNQELSDQKITSLRRRNQKKVFKLDPKVAYIRSLIIPGWGQVYNHRIWKVPIIYAGFGGLGYLVYANHINYTSLQADQRCALDPECDLYSEADEPSIRQARDYFRRNRDLSIAGVVLWFTLQVVDAYVDAHLRNFDISDDLSMSVDPGFHYQPQFNNYNAGLTVSLHLK